MFGITITSVMQEPSIPTLKNSAARWAKKVTTSRPSGAWATNLKQRQENKTVIPSQNYIISLRNHRIDDYHVLVFKSYLFTELLCPHEAESDAGSTFGSK